MTFGYSRDDVSKFLPTYLEQGILKHDPFQVLDQDGVGQLIEMSVQRGRSTRPDLKVGICGEHGGDPASVDFSTARIWITCPARRSASPSRASRRRRRRSRPRRSDRTEGSARREGIDARGERWRRETKASRDAIFIFPSLIQKKEDDQLGRITRGRYPRGRFR